MERFGQSAGGDERGPGAPADAPLREGTGASAALPGDLVPLYEATLERLRRPSRPGLGALLLVGSLAAFLLMQQRETSSWQSVATLVAVLVFHELGHLLAMRAFGYRDVKMFFLPFLGAAVSGRRGSVAVWKEGVMLLLGPAPGIVVGLAIAAAIGTGGPPWLRTVATTLLLLNGFNLLPLAMLDGGKVLQLTLFARHLVSELAFLLLAGLGLLAWALHTDQQVLIYVAVLGLAGLPMRHRLLSAAQALRDRGLSVPADPRELEGGAGREVFRAARDVTSAQHREKQVHLAMAMSSLVELTHRSLPAWRQSALLLGAWALSLALAVAGFVRLTVAMPSWRQHTDAVSAFTVALPAAPVLTERDAEVGPRTVHVRSFDANVGNLGCMVQELRTSGGVWDLQASARALASAVPAEGRVLAGTPRPTRLAGRDAVEVVFLMPQDVRSRFVVLVDGARRYHVAGTWQGERGDRVQRCFDSFHLLR